jgi:hypothetical protein
MLTRSNVSKNYGTSQEFCLNKLYTTPDGLEYSMVDGATCLLALRWIGGAKVSHPTLPGEITEGLTP